MPLAKPRESDESRNDANFVNIAEEVLDYKKLNPARTRKKRGEPHVCAPKKPHSGISRGSELRAASFNRKLVLGNQADVLQLVNLAVGSKLRRIFEL